MKKYTIIENIKKFKETPIDQAWFNDGQKNLKNFITDNPVRNNILESHSWQEGVFKKLILKPMPIAMFAIMLSLITGSGMVAASQNSLPTDKLYPVKLIAEKVEEVVTFNDVKKVELQTKLADKRLGEIENLQSQGKATKAVVEKNMQEYQNNLAKAQGYLNDINTNKTPEKIVAVSTKFEKAIDSQQVVIKNIEDSAPSEYKIALAEGRVIALNNSSQSLKKVRVKINEIEQPVSVVSEGEKDQDKDSTEHNNSGQINPGKTVVGDKEIVPGASNGRVISEETAIKIAAEAGLEKGIKEWKTELQLYHGKINDYVWSVSNTLSKYNGQVVIIDARSGKVYQILDYQIANTLPAPVPEPAPTPVPAPAPEPKTKPIICPEYINCMPQIVEPGEKPFSCEIPAECKGITNIVY